MGLLGNRYPDRADMGGGPDCNKRWGSGMTEKEREELIGKMTDAMFATDEDGTLRVDVMARALAVAEPVIREQCAKIVDELAKEYRLYSRHFPYAEDAEQVAAAIREGGKDE